MPKTEAYHVWREAYENGKIIWVEAITLPLTQSEADAMAVVLGALRPDQVFTSSNGRPMTVTFPSKPRK